MLNNLDRFFDARYPSLASKFGAFITWISSASLLAVRLQITFMVFRRLMEVAALEFAANPNEKLLAKYADAPRARQIERFLKPASFSLETAPSSSPINYSRKRRLNMNVTPDDQNTHNQRHQPGPRNRTQDQCPHGTNGGRGRYNKNFRPPSRTAGRFTCSPNQSSLQSPSSTGRGIHTFLQETPPSVSTSSVTIRPWSPVKG
jgi:hypothetical protein